MNLNPPHVCTSTSYRLSSKLKVPKSQRETYEQFFSKIGSNLLAESSAKIGNWFLRQPRQLSWQFAESKLPSRNYCTTHCWPSHWKSQLGNSTPAKPQVYSGWVLCCDPHSSVVLPHPSETSSYISQTTWYFGFTGNRKRLSSTAFWASSK